MAEVTLTLKQRAQPVMMIKERIETDARAEKIGRTGRRDIDHEGSDQKALLTVEAIVKVRVKGRYLCPPFLKIVKMNRHVKYIHFADVCIPRKFVDIFEFEIADL